MLAFFLPARRGLARRVEALRGVETSRPDYLLSRHMVAPGSPSALDKGEGKGAAVAPQPSEAVDPSALSVVDPALELLDPTPDLQALFLQLNARFFGGRLGGVQVQWSPSMMRSAGQCQYLSWPDGRWRCTIRLSEPILQWRSRRDLVESLLHEMIHAYQCVTGRQDGEQHGPRFLREMRRINRLSGARIVVRHRFFDEADLYRPHWWRCDGPCRHQKPDFGYVKRDADRAPSERDFWWAEHRTTCGGSFVKIRGPGSSQDAGDPGAPSGNKDHPKTVQSQDEGSKADKGTQVPCRQDEDVIIVGETRRGSSEDVIFVGEERRRGSSDDVIVVGEETRRGSPGSPDDVILVQETRRRAAKRRRVQHIEDEDDVIFVGETWRGENAPKRRRVPRRKD